MLFELLAKNRAAYITPSDAWIKEHSKGISECPECPALIQSYYPKPIEPWLEVLPGRQTVNGVWGAACAAMRTDLVALLRPHMPGWVWGRCFNLEGNVIPTHLTCYSRDVLWIRGDEKSEYRGRCSVCGRPRPRREGFPRVLRRDLIPGKHVYFGPLCEILITEELAGTIDWKPFRNIELFRVVVIDEPMDGLPADVRDWPAEPIPPRA